jgi:hypothetical protein
MIAVPASNAAGSRPLNICSVSDADAATSDLLTSLTDSRARSSSSCASSCCCFASAIASSLAVTCFSSARSGSTLC